MIVIELIVLLGAIFLGVRLGGIAIGYAGGVGVLALCCLGLKAGNISWDVILIIASVISAISTIITKFRNNRGRMHQTADRVQEECQLEGYHYVC